MFLNVLLICKAPLNILYELWRYINLYNNNNNNNVNRSQRLNFLNAILYSGAVLIGLFDQTCVDAVISIIYQNSLLGNTVCTIEEN